MIMPNSRQTQNICITFIQRWPNVEDVGPTLYKCYTNVFCLLGMPGSHLVAITSIAVDHTGKQP